MSTQPEDKKKAANYYQGITAPGSPTYCGKRFPKAWESIPLFCGKVFLQYTRILSHNIWDNREQRASPSKKPLFYLNSSFIS